MWSFLNGRTSISWSTRYGWVVDLEGTGERLTGNPQLAANACRLLARCRWCQLVSQFDWLTGGDSHQVFFHLDSNSDVDNASIRSFLRVDLAHPRGIYTLEGQCFQPTFARVTGGAMTPY